MKAIYLQVNAKLQLQTMMIGEPDYLTDTEIEECTAMQQARQSPRPDGRSGAAVPPKIRKQENVSMSSMGPKQSRHKPAGSGGGHNR